MSIPETIPDYLRQFGAELGERILQVYPAPYKPGDPVSPRMRTLLREPYPSQEVAAMSVVRRGEEARAAAVIAEYRTEPLLPPSALAVPSLAAALKFGMRPPASRSRRQEGPSPAHEQFSLF